MQYKKSICFLFALLLLFSVKAQQEYSLDFCVEGLSDNHTIYLGIHRGPKIFPVDSAKTKDTKLQLLLNEKDKAGMYRLIINDSSYFDFLFNYEHIEIHARHSLALEDIKVLQSKENTLLYTYFEAAIFEEKIENFMLQGQELYESDPKGNLEAMLSIKDSIFYYENKKREYAEHLVLENPNTLASSYIQAQIIPEYTQEYALRYDDEYDFLELHFFDNINFKEAALVNTNVLFYAIQDYLTSFVAPATTTNYNKAVDKILALSSATDETYNYTLELLMTTFEKSIWEDVYIHIVEDYYFLGSCSEGTDSLDIKDKIAAMKSLKIGSQAPAISIADTNNVMHSLYNVEAKAIVVLFWGSWCEHCEEDIPKLKSLHKRYKDKGLEIYAVGVEESKENWKTAMIEQDLPWLNLSDISSFHGDACAKYHVWQTPTYFVLDQEKNIYGRPMSTGQLEGMLIELLY
jgi:peroxiredoxin